MIPILSPGKISLNYLLTENNFITEGIKERYKDIAFYVGWFRGACCVCSPFSLKCLGSFNFDGMVKLKKDG